MILTAQYKFMMESSRPHVHEDVRLRILNLAHEIRSLYFTHMNRSTGKTCDICGRGDVTPKHKARDVIGGYEHREHMSPVLCHGHYSGWSKTWRWMPEDQKRSDELIDLRFTQYVADQLVKAAKVSRGTSE